MSVDFVHTETVQTDVLVHELKSSSLPANYLNKFPDEIYNKSPDSHLYKFLFTLLGPSGIGFLKKNLFDIRRSLEAYGLERSHLERFYGDVLNFYKIADESYDQIPSESLSQAGWAEVKAKDESYRNRAIDYLHAVRLGTSPEGMRLAAKSGLGQDVEIIENYQYLFDAHSDDPIGLQNYGQTNSASEFVVLPHYEIDRSVAKTIIFNPVPDSGSFQFKFNGQFSSLKTYNDLNSLGALAFSQTLNEVGIQAQVSGSINDGFLIITNNDYDYVFVNNLYNSGTPSQETITTVIGTQDNQGIQSISLQKEYDVQLALDYLKPVGTFFSYQQNQSTLNRQSFIDIHSTSYQLNVTRFVTGSKSVQWPSQSPYWIVKDKEVEAPRVYNDIKQHYQGFHTPVLIKAYTDDNVNSERPTSSFSNAFPYNIAINTDDQVYFAKNALPVQTEPQQVTTSYTDSNGQLVGLINGIYPTGYTRLQGVAKAPSVPKFWASIDRPAMNNGSSTSEFLEIDLGSSKAVNFIMMEALGLPFDIKIQYQINGNNYAEITNESVGGIDFPYETSIYYENKPDNPWDHLTYNFTDSLGNMIFTRKIKIQFTRRDESNSANPLFYNKKTSTYLAWPIVVRNLRIGRNV